MLTSDDRTEASVSLFAGPTGSEGSTAWALVSTTLADGELAVIQAVQRRDDGRAVVASEQLTR